MSGEQKIIIAGVVILAVGVTKAALDKKPLDVPIIGGVTFVLLLSLVSALGPALSSLAGDFALLGMATVVLVDGPAVVQELQTVQSAGNPVSSTPTTCADTGYPGFTTTGCGPCHFKDNRTYNLCVPCSNCKVG